MPPHFVVILAGVELGIAELTKHNHLAEAREIGNV